MKSDDQIRNDPNTHDPMRKWDSLVDQRIHKVIGDGDMSWHPKAGVHIDLDEDQFVSADQRIAAKIMKDNEAVPPWVALAFTLRNKHEKFIKRSQQYAQDYVRRSHEAMQEGSFVRERKIRQRWEEAIQRLTTEVETYNRELFDYNLQIPPQVGQMVPLDPKELVEKALASAKRHYGA